ncbi:hypothetical protein AZ602_00360 [Moraxella sp. RCAD0137]|nr:hypothetical protein AZ602_00360 [Moraxella sp. RCAD0137]
MEMDRFSDKVIDLLKNNYLFVSPMVKLELQYLYEIKRLNDSPEMILQSLKQSINLSICQKSWLDVVNTALTCDFTRDAFDRLIVAHAMLDNSILISKDSNLTKHYQQCVW